VMEMHVILNFAKFAVTDSQTMSIEAAVLGVPAVRINTFAGKSSVIEELEEKYQLIFSFTPEDTDSALREIASVIRDSSFSLKLRERHYAMLAEKGDLNEWMKEFLAGI